MRLRLMDGTVIEGGEAGFSLGFLWLYCPGMTMAEAAAVFLDPEKTGEIRFEYGEMEDTFERYTVCTAMSVDPDGLMSVCLVRP